MRAKKNQLPLGMKELRVKDVFFVVVLVYFCSATTTLYATLNLDPLGSTA